MKTSEFIKRLDELECNVQDGEWGFERLLSYEIHDANADFVGKICREEINMVKTYTDDCDLIRLCLEYAGTPIEEREDDSYSVPALLHLLGGDSQNG